MELNDLGECVPLREEGFYFDGEERLRCPEKCAKCNEDGKCDECNEGAFKDEKDDECKCKFGFVEAANGECMKKGTSEICLPNFVFIDGECKRCDDSCQTCDGTGPLDCKICADNFIRNKIGACECEEGFFLDIHCKCKRCAPGCLDCIGERPEDCRECAKGTVGPNCECLEGWYFEEDYNECIPEHLEVDCEYW